MATSSFVPSCSTESEALFGGEDVISERQPILHSLWDEFFFPRTVY